MANLLTGGIDQFLTRSDNTGSYTPLRVPDRLGCTLGLVDSSGSVTTSYTYDPFGATAASGSANNNPYKFTGREKEIPEQRRQSDGLWGKIL